MLLRLARRSETPGSVFFALIALSGGTRIALEVVRYNAEAELLLRLGPATVSIYQAVSAAILFAGLAGWAWVHRRASTVLRPA